MTEFEIGELLRLVKTLGHYSAYILMWLSWISAGIIVFYGLLFNSMQKRNKFSFQKISSSSILFTTIGFTILPIIIGFFFYWITYFVLQ